MILSECAAREKIRDVLKLSKNHPDFRQSVYDAFEQAKTIKNNGKILLGLWERADKKLREEIFVLLEQLDFKNCIKNQLSFEIIKLRMGRTADEKKINILLEKCEPEFRAKAQNILKQCGFTSAKYIFIGDFILNYGDLSSKNTYKLQGSIIEKVKKPDFDNISIVNISKNSTSNEKAILRLENCQTLKSLKFFENKVTKKVVELIHQGNFHLTQKLIITEINRAKTDFEFSFLHNILSLILRLANIPGPFPQIYFVCNQIWEKSLFNRQFLFKRMQTPYRDFKNYIGSYDLFKSKIRARGPVFLFYKKNGILKMYDFINQRTIPTNIKIERKIADLNQILVKSRETIRRKVTKKSEVQKWWSDRHSLNLELERLLNFQIDYNFPKSFFICLDEDLVYFPFEHSKYLEKYSIMRLPCSEYVSSEEKELNINLSELKIVTGQNLTQTEEKVRRFKEKHDLKTPETNETDLFVYFGHGSGKEHFSQVNSKQYMLFGCSSVRLIERTGFKKIGAALDLLNKNCKSVMGCLWDVTDLDIDAFGLTFLEQIIEGKNYDIALKEALKKMRLRFLNGASIVCYSKILL